MVSAEFSRGAELARQLEASYEARGQIRELRSQLQDVEIGQRGYLLTGNLAFLAPYDSARDDIDESFAAIARQVGRSGRVANLRAHVEAKLNFVDHTVALAKAGRGAESIALVSGGDGKRMMDRIRREIDAIQAEEARRINAALADADHSRQRTRWFVMAIFAALGLLLLAAAVVSLLATRARNAATARYRDMSARQEAIFESAQDGIVTINPSGSIESANLAVGAMTGYDSADLIRRDVGMLVEIAPDEGRNESFVHRLDRARRDAPGQPIALFARRKDGSLLPCDVTVSEVALGDDRIFVAIVRDTTERTRIDVMKREFVSTVSHELRTPLTSISGSLGLLAGGAVGALPEKADWLIRIARGNCERLIRLINDILDMEKIESGKMDFHVEPLPLADLLGQAVQQNQGFAAEHGVNIELGEVPGGAAIVGDRDRMMQVLTNLLSNAAKFSPKGEAVRVSVQPLDRRWRIDVADRGPGIPETFQARIFGKFAQADGADSREKGGTGLGLSIVREIVTRLGGAVSFTSAEGAGSTFHVDMPSHDLPRTHREHVAGAPTILHVEDDPDVVSIVADALGGRYAHDAALTLAEARKALAAGHYDIAILDFALPDGNGAELIAELREAGTPIVVFTAQDAGADPGAPVDALLVKSRASLTTLVETLDRLVAQKKKEA